MNINGYKTYIWGVVVLVYAGVGLWLGIHDQDQFAALVAIAMSALGLRHGIAKNGGGK